MSQLDTKLIFTRTLEENIELYGSFSNMYDALEKDFPSNDWEELYKDFADSLHGGNGDAEEALERAYFYYKKKRFV